LPSSYLQLLSRILLSISGLLIEILSSLKATGSVCCFFSGIMKMAARMPLQPIFVIFVQKRKDVVFGALTLLVGHQEEHPACKN